MYPGLSHDEIIEECLKELKHYFEVGPEVALISAEKGVQCVLFDESLQKKFPYFEGTYEVFDVPHTDFQIRYQPEQILAASGRKILTGTAFLCRRENERCLISGKRIICQSAASSSWMAGIFGWNTLILRSNPSACRTWS